MAEIKTDTIRQGLVSSINYAEGRVCVTYPDKNGAVTDELPLQSFEYDMPKVGDPVYVVHQSNGLESGLVLSRYWHDGNLPIEYGPHIHRKEYGPDAFMRYDRDKKILTLNFDKLVITGDVLIKGDVKIKGKLETEGTFLIKDGLEVEGAALFSKDVQIDGKTLMNSDAEIVGGAVVSGDLLAKNNFTVERNTEIERDLHVKGHFAADEGDIPDIPYEPEEGSLVPKEIETFEEFE